MLIQYAVSIKYQDEIVDIVTKLAAFQTQLLIIILAYIISKNAVMLV